MASGLKPIGKNFQKWVLNLNSFLLPTLFLTFCSSRSRILPIVSARKWRLVDYSVGLRVLAQPLPSLPPNHCPPATEFVNCTLESSGWVNNPCTFYIFVCLFFNCEVFVGVPESGGCSFAQSCPSLYDSTDCSSPGFCILYRLPELAQTQVHWVGDAIQTSHTLSSPSPPALNLSQHQGLFQWVSSLHHVAKVWALHLQHQCFQWVFRVDFL